MSEPEVKVERVFSVTEKAAEFIKTELQAQNVPNSVRISIIGGGCSGFQYQIDFDTEERMGDIKNTFFGLDVLVDPVSMGYLKQATVDYKSGLNGSGLVFDNPGVQRTCGCSKSFS